jgi:hypothetical protein
MDQNVLAILLQFVDVVSSGSAWFLGEKQDISMVFNAVQDAAAIDHIFQQPFFIESQLFRAFELQLA